jgi:hypothetical protein
VLLAPKMGHYVIRQPRTYEAAHVSELFVYLYEGQELLDSLSFHGSQRCTGLFLRTQARVLFSAIDGPRGSCVL